MTKVKVDELSPKFDPQTGELVGSRGEDYVVISAEALRRTNLYEELLLGLGSFVMWYNSGKAVGRVDGEKYRPLMQSMDLQEFATLLRESYSRFGWGYIEYKEVDPNSGELLFTVRNPPSCVES